MAQGGNVSSNQIAPGRKRHLLRLLLKWILAPALLMVLLAAGFSVVFPSTVQAWLQAGIWRAFPHYLAWRAQTGSFQAGVRAESTFVPMRDGVRLKTDLHLPDLPGAFPVIVVRTPYTREEARPVGMFFARYGYAVVIQDVRGRHDSEGEFYPFRSEQADGMDLTAWLQRQPWCDGKIGGFGGSYMGITQWAMASGNREVASITPIFATADIYSGIYRSGVFSKLTFLHWSLTSHGRHGDVAGARHIEKGYKHFPLRESDDASGHDIEFYNHWVDRPVPDGYWQSLHNRDWFSSTSAPAFLIGGWYDFFAETTIDDFLLLRRTAPPEVRGLTKLLVGPWSHGFFSPNLANYGIQPRWMELVPFEVVHDIKAWYDYSLKGIDNGWDRRAAVRVYVLGEDVWRDEEEWPPDGTSMLTYYLRSEGKAGSDPEDGRLVLDAPAESDPPDVYQYDPRNPVPTRGGRHGDHWTWGPVDQRRIQERPDVLVYTSEPLAEPLRVMGTVTARLFASSTALDTDFTAKLVDVFPDGRALIVCEGVIRARYRNGLHQPELLQPGEVYAFDIRIGDTAVLFGRGHRVRLEVSSSNYPRYDANPNTGGEIACERRPRIATQTLFHSPEFPSALNLPAVSQ
jgi:uncharacterized protein